MPHNDNKVTQNCYHLNWINLCWDNLRIISCWGGLCGKATRKGPFAAVKPSDHLVSNEKSFSRPGEAASLFIVVAQRNDRRISNLTSKLLSFRASTSDVPDTGNRFASKWSMDGWMVLKVIAKRSGVVAKAGGWTSNSSSLWMIFMHDFALNRWL